MANPKSVSKTGAAGRNVKGKAPSKEAAKPAAKKPSSLASLKSLTKSILMRSSGAESKGKAGAKPAAKPELKKGAAEKSSAAIGKKKLGADKINGKEVQPKAVSEKPAAGALKQNLKQPGGPSTMSKQNTATAPAASAGKEKASAKPTGAKAASGGRRAARGEGGRSARGGAHDDSVCREVACEGLATTIGYCRLHYIKNWKKIKRKEQILRDGKLNQYIEELVSKYPEKYIEAIRQDLASDKDFAKVIHDLDLDESIDEFDMEGESVDSLIDNIRRDFEDEGEAF